jgi:pimeloyl-ACP methyl ester carboxylesterase
MTRFAEQHGDRCSGLVYLDATYDYSIGDVARIYQETPPPEAPPMDAADSASVESVQAWYGRTQGFTPPVSQVREAGLFDSDGRYLGRKPMTSTRRRVDRLEKPSLDLDALDCPSLGLFPVPGPLGLWLPYYDDLDPQERQKADAWQGAYSAWAEAQRQNFDRYPKNEVIEFPNTGHMFFLEKPEEASSAIRDFVLGLR